MLPLVTRRRAGIRLARRPRIAEDVAPDIYELCSKCNTSFLAFMQKDDASFEAWLKESEQ